jgi:hypothetical protein
MTHIAIATTVRLMPIERVAQPEIGVMTGTVVDTEGTAARVLWADGRTAWHAVWLLEPAP